MRLMRFSTLQDVGGHRELLEAQGCEIIEATNTGRLARRFSLVQQYIEEQRIYDALRIVDFNESLLSARMRSSSLGSSPTTQHERQPPGVDATILAFVARL